MRRYAWFAAPVLALGLALTACGSPGAPEPISTPTEAPSDAQSPSVGDVVTPEPDAGPLPGWSSAERPYKMLDGTYVLVAPRQPLPENVRGDIEARLAEIAPAPSGADPRDVEATWGAFSRLAAQLRDETGRAVIIFTNTAVPSSGLARWVHFGGTARENIPSYESVPGGSVTVEEYQKAVFDRSNESFFDVFYR